MKSFAIVSLLLISSLSYGAEVPKSSYEENLSEILACGYVYFADTNGSEYLCYGEVSKMNFDEKADCRKVRGTLDKETKRLVKIRYIDNLKAKP